MGRYETKYLNIIKDAKDDKTIVEIINKIYEDGFADGNNEKE